MAQVKDPVTRPNGGGERSHQIEADIDRTRAAMDRTVDAIAGKLTPQQLLLEALGVFKDGSSALANKVVQTAREHPVPATIIGIGIGLLLTERGKSSASSVDPRHVGFGGYGEHPAGEPSVRTEGVAGAVRDRTVGVKDAVVLGAMEAREKVGETAAHVKEQVSHAKDQVKTQAEHVPVYARQQWHDAQLGFWRTMDEKPFAVGMAALAAGVAAGLTVPATRKEKELMGETRDRLVDQAKDLGREAVDKGKQVARAATDVVKAEVERQGLKPSAIAEKVRAIGREAEQALKSEAERVMPEPLRATGAAAGEETKQGGAAGRGMSAGFASTGSSPADPTATQRVVSGKGSGPDRT